MYWYVFICYNIYIFMYIYNAIVFQSFNFFHLRKGLYSKRREFNKFILRDVFHIVLIRCRLIYDQHYAPYEHIYIYIYMCVCVCVLSEIISDKLTNILNVFSRQIYVTE